MISSAVKTSRGRRRLHNMQTVSSTFDSYNDNIIPSKPRNRFGSLPSVCSFSSFVPKSVISSVGPATLVGGTAAIYSSLLHHPSSTLNQLSFILMMLLAVQYAIQPRLSRKYISPKIQKQSVALVEEVVKTSFAAAIFFAKPAEEVGSALKDWSLSSSLTCAGLPAMLYAVQGVLQYVSYQHLDPVTFNGLTQTKTLSAAVCCWWILNKPQSPLQMLALGILFASALVFQGYIKIESFGKAKKHRNETKSVKSQPVPTMPVLRKRNDWWWCGVAPCLGAAFLSGLAGAFSQKGLQLTGIRGRDPFLYTMEVSFFSAVSLLLHMVRTHAFSEKKWQNQRVHWNWQTFLPIVLKASSGVVTALVHKHAGSVSKGFALMVGLVLSNMIQLTRTQESLQSHQVLGTLLILLSTWLHFTNPP